MCISKISFSHLTLFLFFLTTTGHSQESDSSNEFDKYVASSGPRLLTDFREFLRLPCTTNNVANLEANAKYLLNELSEIGVSAELVRLEGKAPLVVGSLFTETATRTVGIYCHYDGQLSSPEDAWTATHNKPFEPLLYSGSFEGGGLPIPFPTAGEPVSNDWRIYARASADDKGPIFALLKTLEFLKGESRKLSVNIIFMFDGQEESGSPNLADYMRMKKEVLSKPELWIICDGPVHPSGFPTMVFGARGMIKLNVTLYGAATALPDGTIAGKELHSGHYGNWAPNPAMNLARLLSSMKDAQGDVTIPRFYESSIPLSPTEDEELLRIPNVDSELLMQYGLGAPESSRSLEASINRPSLTIRGFISGNAPVSINLPNSNIISIQTRAAIPAEATASLEIRLVKGNDPLQMSRLLEQHIHSQGYVVLQQAPSIEILRKYPRVARCISVTDYRAAKTPMDAAVVLPVRDAVKIAARGKGPIVQQPTMGASLPLYLFEDILDRPFVVVPTVNFDNNQHAPNENLLIENLWYAMRFFHALLSKDR